MERARIRLIVGAALVGAVLLGRLSVEGQGPWTTPPGTNGKIRITSTATDALCVGGSSVAPSSSSCTGGIYAGPAVVNGNLSFTSNLIAPAEFDNGNSSTAITINWNTHGPLQKVTRNGSATYTLTAPAGPGYVTLKLLHDGTGTAYTVTFSP